MVLKHVRVEEIAEPNAMSSSFAVGNPVGILSSYEISHLAEHLALSGRSIDLHVLLALETASARNAWHEIKLLNSDVSGYLADLARAWAILDEGSLGSSDRVSLRARYALLSSSTRTTVNTFPPALLKALLVKGLWSAETVWSYYSQIADHTQRLNALRILAPVLPEHLVREAFDGWIGSGPTSHWSAALVALAPRLSNALINRAVNAFIEHLYESDKVSSFTGFAPYLSKGEFELIVGHVHDEVWSSGVATSIVAGIAPFMPPELLSTAVQILLDDGWYGDAGWSAISTRLDAEHVRSVLARIESDSERCGARSSMQALAPLLTQLARLGFADEAINRMVSAPNRHDICLSLLPILVSACASSRLLALIAELLPSDPLKADAIERIGKTVAPDAPPILLDIALKMSDARSRATALCAIALRLDCDARHLALAEALASAKSVRSGYPRALTLCKVADTLARAGEPEEAVQAIEAALDISSSDLKDGCDRPADTPSSSQVLTDCLGYLTASLKREQLTAHLNRIDRLRDDVLVGRAISLAAPHLSPEICEYELRRAQSIDKIIALAPVLPQSLLKYVLTDMYEKFIPDFRPALIAGLAAHLSEPLLQDSVRLMQRIQDRLGQAVALASFASLSTLPDSEETGMRAFLTAQLTAPYSDGARSQVLSDIAPYLPATILHFAIDDAKRLTYDFLSGPTLTVLLRELASRGYSEEAWEEALQMSDDYKTEALAELIDLVPSGLLSQMPDIIASLPAASQATELLHKAIPRLSDDAIAHVVENALEHTDGKTGISILASVAARVPTRLLPKVLEVARASEVRELSAMILAGAATATSDGADVILLREAIELLHPPVNQHAFVDAVVAVAKATTQLAVFQELVAAIDHCADEIAHAGSLAAIATYAPPEIFDHLCRRAESFGHEQAEFSATVAREQARRGDPDRAIKTYLKVPAWAKGNAMKEIAPHLSGAHFDEVLKDASTVDDTHGARTRIIEAIVPHLPPNLLTKGVEMVLAISNKFNRKTSLKSIVRQLLRSVDGAHELDRLLRRLANENRLDVLYDLASVAPLIVSLGGPRANKSVVLAIDDVVRWWS